MIQKGIIESIEDTYQVKVRIPKYDKTTYDGVKSTDLSTAIICALPGSTISYDVGDVVLIGFENDELSKPVVLGSLYRKTESNSSSIIPYVDEAITDIQTSLDTINSANTYTHIKYSNDNGKTFTSLYDYSDVKSAKNSQSENFYYDLNISINSESKVVVWSILNDLNYNVTSDYIITTYVHKQEFLESDFIDGNLISDVFVSNEFSFVIPANYFNADELYLSFKIIYSGDLNSNYISLTTDKDDIGSVYGDYTGFCIDTNYESSTEITDYSWSSSLERNMKLVSNVTDELLRRIESNEQSLYGYNKSDSNNKSDGTGLKDGIEVSNDAVFIGTSKHSVNFDISNEVYVDIDNKSVNTNKLNMNPFIFTKKSNGHLCLTFEER